MDKSLGNESATLVDYKTEVPNGDPIKIEGSSKEGFIESLIKGLGGDSVVTQDLGEATFTVYFNSDTIYNTLYVDADGDSNAISLDNMQKDTIKRFTLSDFLDTAIPESGTTYRTGAEIFNVLDHNNAPSYDASGEEYNIKYDQNASSLTAKTVAILDGSNQVVTDHSYKFDMMSSGSLKKDYFGEESDVVWTYDPETNSFIYKFEAQILE